MDTYNIFYIAIIHGVGWALGIIFTIVVLLSLSIAVWGLIKNIRLAIKKNKG